MVQSHIAHSLGSTESPTIMQSTDLKTNVSKQRVRSTVSGAPCQEHRVRSTVEERPFRAAFRKREIGALAPVAPGSKIEAP